MLLGKQVVKGENYFILCEARTIYPHTEPKAVVFVVNVFEGKSPLVGITLIGKENVEMLCGYAFTWLVMKAVHFGRLFFIGATVEST